MNIVVEFKVPIRNVKVLKNTKYAGETVNEEDFKTVSQEPKLQGRGILVENGHICDYVDKVQMIKHYRRYAIEAGLESSLIHCKEVIEQLLGDYHRVIPRTSRETWTSMLPNYQNVTISFYYYDT